MLNMHQFTYENQGTETFLSYHLEQGETLDHFARGMLQSNEIGGIIKPAFTMRDTDQYLKYPITSRLPLKEYIQRDMERKDVLKFCQSFAETVGEIQEYMLSQEKLVLDTDVIFVDVGEKKAEFIYLPIDEFQNSVSPEEFLRSFLSRLRFRQEGDLSYVAKLLHFLNQPGGMDLDELKRILIRLTDEKEETQKQVFAPIQDPVPAASQPPYYQDPVPAASQPPYYQDPVPAASQPPYHQDPVPAAPQPPYYQDPVPAAPQPPYHQNPDIGSSSMPGMIPDMPSGPFEPEVKGKKNKGKEKKGLFGRHEKNEKGLPPTPVAVPGMEIPMNSGVKPEPEIILKVDENGAFLPDQGVESENHKKKGLFHFGKKKKEKKAADMPPAPVSAPVSAPVQEFPGAAPGFSVPPVQAPIQEGYYRDPSVSYSGRSDSSEPENKTVILGGGNEYGSTVILGNSDSSQQGQRASVARLVRRRNGQSAFINKEVFHIGREGSFADFYIGDNPAIGSAHADIFVDGTEYYICDRNSQNHTYVNRQMVLAGQRIRLTSGDVVTLADEDFDFFIQS